MSESSIEPTLGIVVAPTKLIKMLPSSMMRKAVMSAALLLPKPTSDPSRYILQTPLPVSKANISSSAKLTPPTLPLLVELT
jgi:hypothetical protein